MKTAILYGSRVKLTNAHKPVHTVGNPNPPRGAEKQPAYFVRMKVTPWDLDEALLKAKPMVGETVLNTVEL